MSKKKASGPASPPSATAPTRRAMLGTVHAMNRPLTPVDLFDALTLEVERADVLAEHLADRLSDLSDRETAPPELHALSLIAQGMRETHARIHEKAQALLAAAGGAR